MTTELAPPTVPSVQTGTPPEEWASVLASKPANLKDTPAWSSEIPGKGDNLDISAERLRETSQVTQGIGQTSRGSKKELRISLPSTELTGARPSERTGGIGALPGNLSESSVALLPDEREERAQECRSTSPRQRRDTLKPSVAGDGEELRKLEKEAMVSKDEPVTSELSVTPIQSTKGGETVESDVTAGSGPEVSQRETGDIKNQQTPSEQQWASATTVAGEAPAENSIERSILVSEKPDHGKVPPQDDHQGDNGKASHSTKGGYGGDYHPALLHPPPPGTSVAESQSPVSTQQRGQDASTMTGETVGTTKKPGFMTMVKGEMKIFAGKISGDEHTVEEGKKLVQGSA